MGVNQSKLNYEPSLRSQRSSRIVGDGDSRPNTSKLYQQRTIVKEETEPTLSRCTTRHGVLDPTTHSHYNDTTLKQPSKSTTLSPSTITRHNNNQHVLDSGYSSGWQQSSVLFSHISSNITTATDLSHFCLDDKPTNTASIVAQVAAATTCSNTSSASSSIAPHGIEKAATPISTKSILNQLAHAPHETQVILDGPEKSLLFSLQVRMVKLSRLYPLSLLSHQSMCLTLVSTVYKHLVELSLSMLFLLHNKKMVQRGLEEWLV